MDLLVGFHTTEDPNSVKINKVFDLVYPDYTCSVHNTLYISNFLGILFTFYFILFDCLDPVYFAKYYKGIIFSKLYTEKGKNQDPRFRRQFTCLCDDC